MNLYEVTFFLKVRRFFRKKLGVGVSAWYFALALLVTWFLSGTALALSADNPFLVIGQQRLLDHQPALS